MIHINQVGYRPDDLKTAFFTDNAKSFKVLDDQNNIVYEGNTFGCDFDPLSGDTVSYGDFTALKNPGKYTIKSDTGEISFPLYINKNPYKDLLKALLKFYYYQRCGCELTEKYAGEYAHAACHTTDAVILNTNDYKEVSGGWHDAGDYGRYITAAATAVSHILLAYENIPLFKTLKFDIPKSTDLPDTLEEVKYELLWMLKMQSKTGGVYHKATTYRFPVVIMPDKDDMPQAITPVSSTATADFAASLAIAARIYTPYDKEFAERCKNAAVCAWSWLENNPGLVGYFRPDGILTGAYGDKDDADERYWAAAELFKLTGEQKYHNYLLNNECKFGTLGVYNVGFFAVLSYLSIPENLRNEALYNKLKDILINFAHERLKICGSGYKVSLRENEYNWGCNINIGNYALLLLYANKYLESNEIQNAIMNHVNYLLGANAVGKCFVSGFGSNPVLNPHYRPSKVVGKALKGMVAGGPDFRKVDETARVKLVGLPPAKCYLDEYLSYSTNEVAIYWNSPFVWLLGYFTE